MNHAGAHTDRFDSFRLASALAAVVGSLLIAPVACSTGTAECTTALYAEDASCDAAALCELSSTCPNDVPADETARASCRAGISGPCGDLYGAYVACVEEKRVCTSSGTTDETLTEGNCPVHYAQWLSCLNGG